MKSLKNGRLKSLAGVLVLLVASLAACSSQVKPDTIVQKDQIQSEQTKKTALYTGQSLSMKASEFRKAANTGDYRIGPGDLLEVSVFQADELKNSLRVSGNGYIKLPLVGAIKAKGRTSTQLENDLAKKYGKYLQDPVVSVFVKEYRSQQISVLGSVKDPKVYYVSGQVYLLDVLSLAGGLTPEAGTICIIQRYAEGKQKKGGQIAIDLNELLIKGRSELNIPLYSGDVVSVPESGIFFVDGAVGGPGSFRLKGNLTLTQAISMAKGLDFTAEKGNIKIYRDKGGAKRQIISCNYNQIMDGKTPDVPIKDKDVIIVPKNTVKVFLKGISTSLHLGFFDVGNLGNGFQ